MEVKKSKGKTIYLNGLCVFEEENGSIRISRKGDIAHPTKGSDVENFFKEIITKTKDGETVNL